MTARPADAAQEARTSDTIAIARVLCVLGIIYVHAWTGLSGDALSAVAGSGQDRLRWTLMEVFGRGAVPLLSLISGWLVAKSRRRRGYRTFVAGKARVILLPMVAWNGLSILIVSGAAYLGVIRAPTLASFWWLIDELFCLLTPNDINVQSSFLRDLFLCMLAAPLLVRAGGRWLVLVAAVLAMWTVGTWAVPLLLRPQIGLFFVLGIMAARGDVAVRAARLHPIIATVPAALLVPVKIALASGPGNYPGLHPHLVASVDLALRLAMALLFWRLAWLLAGARAAAGLKRLERYAFLTFCAHLILIWLGGPLIGNLTGPLGSPAYPAYLIAQPLLLFAACVLLGRALVAVSPDAASMLSGGRLTEPARGGGTAGASRAVAPQEGA